MHGDGNGGPPRMSIPEALALMGEPRTPLDRLVRFVCEQNADTLTALKATPEWSIRPRSPRSPTPPRRARR
jgi:hypothetical protein